MRDPSFLNSSSLDKFPQDLIDALDPVGSNIFSYNVTVRQPLYTAGRVGTALRLASVEAEGSLADIDRAEQDLAVEVTKAYYGLLWAEGYRENVAEVQQQRLARDGLGGAHRSECTAERCSRTSIAFPSDSFRDERFDFAVRNILLGRALMSCKSTRFFRVPYHRMGRPGPAGGPFLRCFQTLRVSV